MFFELKKAGLKVEQQKPLPLLYEEIKLDVGYKIDIMIENKVIIELKSVKELTDIHFAQNYNIIKIIKLQTRIVNKFQYIIS